MKRAVLLVCCLLPACPPTSANTPAAPVSCRESDGPKDCQPATGIGGHQGGVLEGNGLERLHFSVPPGAFPPAAGTTLKAVDACGTDSNLRVLVKTCAPILEFPGTGAFACVVDVVGDTPVSLVPALRPLCAT